MSTGQIKILITHQSSSNICVIPLIKSIEYDNYYYAKAEMQHLLSKAVPYHQQHILERKRNAYFDFQNDGFIMRTYFVLIPIMYTHLRWQFNSLTIFFLQFLLMTHIICHDVIATYRHAPIIPDDNQSSKTSHCRRKWIAE